MDLEGSKMSRRRHSGMATGKRLLGVGAAAATALAIAACGSSSSNKTSSTGSTANTSKGTIHLTWWTMWSGDSLKPVNEMVSEFNKTHPGIVVSTTAIASSAATSSAKLLASIAAGDPPDVFTEWWPQIGTFAAKGDLDPISPYLTKAYAGYKSWAYPVSIQAGTYNGSIYSVPMSLNSWGLYYNKAMLSKVGVTKAPTTIAQLDANQAKAWVTSGGQLKQIGFYPYASGNGFQFYAPYFNAVNCISNGKYDYEDAATCPGAIKEMDWIQSYDKYSYEQVTALQTAVGGIAGGQTDVFADNKAAYELTGPWEAAEDIPATDKTLPFGVTGFPQTDGSESGTIGQGNFNIIPKGSKNPAAAAEFILWLAGYHNESYIAGIDVQGGWIPAGAAVTKAPAYVAWIKRDPYMATFLSFMSSKNTVAPALTPTEAQVSTAMSTATANVLQKTMTPLQALKYIDQQGNQTS